MRALNLIGWGDFSSVNDLGAVVFVEPYKMLTPIRGYDTSELLIQIQWFGITPLSKETGGSPIDSYNL